MQDIFVSIPTTGVTGVKLHKPYAALEHPAGEQTAGAEFGGFLLAEPVEIFCLGVFARKIDNLRRGSLHAEGKFVGVQPCHQRIIVVTLGEMLTVEALNEAGEIALALRRTGSRRLEVKNWIGTGPQGCALISGGEESVAPGGRPALEPTARIRQHDKSRHVVVLCAKPIGDPTTNGRFAHKNGAGVHLINRLRMIDAVAMATAQHAKAIGMAGKVRQEIAHLQAGLAMLAERFD